MNRRPLLVFFTGSIALGWAITLLSAQFVADPVLLPLIALPVSYVPAAMALIALRLGADAAERQRFLRRLTTVRVGARWYVLVLVGLPLVHVAGVAAATALDGVFPFHPGALALLPLFLITNLGEEIGWRGYALPRLRERFGPFTASLIVGLAWAAFHWVALAGDQDAPVAYVALGTALLVAMSVIMTFVFDRAGQSVPVMAVLHASFDTVSIGVIPLVETTVPLTAFGFTTLTAWLVVLAVVIRTGRRTGRPSPRPAHPLRVPREG